MPRGALRGVAGDVGIAGDDNPLFVVVRQRGNPDDIGCIRLESLAKVN